MQGPHADTLPGSISDLHQPSVQRTRHILSVECTHQPDVALLDPARLCQCPTHTHPWKSIIEDSLWNLSFLGEP